MRIQLIRLPALLLILAGTLTLTTSGCNSSSGWMRNQVGKHYYTSGDYTAARRSFEQAMMDNPWNPDYAFNVAAAMQRQGDHLAAERMYQHALTLNPSHQPSYHALAGLLHEDGRTDEAQDLLSAWVDTQPYMPESHVEMAWMQQELGDYGAAEASLHQALQQNPRHARAMAQLGQVYQRTGRSMDAASLYNRSLGYNRMQPQVAAQLRGMGPAYAASPGLMMAQQLPQYDPTYGSNPMFSAAPYPTAPAYNAATFNGVPRQLTAQYGQPMYGQSMPGYGAPQPVGTGPVFTANQLVPSSGYPGQTIAPVNYETTTGPGVPTYSPPSVNLGTPGAINDSPAAAVPAISAAMPMVTPF